MAKPEMETSLKTVFEVRIRGAKKPVQFKIGAKDGSDAQVSFDGRNWYPASTIYHSMNAFSDRFPTAFEDI